MKTKILLTSFEQQPIIVDENYRYRLQYLKMEEMFDAGLNLQEAINEIEDFCNDWVPLEMDISFGWGGVIDTAEADIRVQK